MLKRLTILTIGESGKCILELLSPFSQLFCKTEIIFKQNRGTHVYEAILFVPQITILRVHFICTSNHAFPCLLVLFCFPHLLIWYLQLPVNMLLNSAAKYAISNARGTIKKIESG